MPSRPSPSRVAKRGRRCGSGSLCAWLLDDSREIEAAILGGFDDWHAELGDDDRSPDPEPDEVP